MNDRVCAAVTTCAKKYDDVFEFRLYGDTLAVKHMGKLCDSLYAESTDIAKLAKDWLDKWCARRKVRHVRIFQPHNAAEVGVE